MTPVLSEYVLAPCRTSMRILIRSTSSSEASTVIGCDGGRLKDPHQLAAISGPLHKPKERRGKGVSQSRHGMGD